MLGNKHRTAVFVRQNGSFVSVYFFGNFYNVDFKVMDPVLDSYRLTGTFNNRQLSQILDYLRISSRIDYSIKRMEMDDSLSAQREQVVLRRIK